MTATCFHALRPFAFPLLGAVSLLVLLFLVQPSGVDGQQGESGFPEVKNSEKEEGDPMSAADAAAAIEVPEGFEVEVFASEPELRNPIGMAWDNRGRLWVAENYTYAERTVKFELDYRDRVLVFEDRDGDGRADQRKVFTDQVQRLTSVEVGHGGVWLMCPPQLLYFADRDRDDQPDGPAEVVLDGFEVPADNYHNFANGLRFGPDGWLYGRCGASAPGEVGAPGTPAEERIPLRGTLWRYHPITKVFEALSGGTTNPWGHDWNAQGELFFINTVNGHLWHGITGAHFVRPHTIDPNPHVYRVIDMHADHWHFDTSGSWTKSRDGAANAYGGGHAHCGVMIYQGDNWPERYRGKLFTLNFHGRRANQEHLERSGSGYVARHNDDFFVSKDPWFRGIDLSYGPDGGVYVLDWSDTGECHEFTGVHRHSGRAFKITHGKPRRPLGVNLREASLEELVAHHEHANEWFVRRAREEIRFRSLAATEPATTGGSLGQVATGSAFRGTAITALKKELADKPTVEALLRYVWTLYQIGVLDEESQIALIEHPNEHVRVWGLRLLSDHWPLDTQLSARWNDPEAVAEAERHLPRLAAMAKEDASAMVRLALASLLQRLPVAMRAEVARGLVSHASDADDHNLPLMIWYGLIPIADQDPAALAEVFRHCRLPTTRQCIARRLAEEIESNPAPLETLITEATEGSGSVQADLVRGMEDALRGWRKAPEPAGWPSLAAAVTASSDESLKAGVRELGVLFGGGRAMGEVRALALDKSADLEARKRALQTLIESEPEDMREICENLLGERFLNTVAMSGLTRIDDPELGRKIAKHYRRFHASERPAVIDALVARPAFAAVLLEELEADRIPREAVSAFHARQIRSFGDEALDARLAESWGELRESAADKQEQMEALKAALDAEALAAADLSKGRQAYEMVCAACHKMYGKGGHIGPDLTGSGRANLDYLLENIVDPSAVVTADFRMAVITLKDGRVLNGVITGRTDRTVEVQTLVNKETVDRSQVTKTEILPVSIMPEGLLQALSPEQTRDLIGYLMHPNQVPLPGAE